MQKRKRRLHLIFDCRFVMGGNKISVKTVDLNKEFKLIAAQLDKIAEEHLGIKGRQENISV